MAGFFKLVISFFAIIAVADEFQNVPDWAMLIALALLAGGFIAHSDD